MAPMLDVRYLAPLLDDRLLLVLLSNYLVECPSSPYVLLACSNPATDNYLLLLLGFIRLELILPFGPQRAVVVRCELRCNMHCFIR